MARQQPEPMRSIRQLYNEAAKEPLPKAIKELLERLD